MGIESKNQKLTLDTHQLRNIWTWTVITWRSFRKYVIQTKKNSRVLACGIQTDIGAFHVVERFLTVCVRPTIHRHNPAAQIFSRHGGHTASGGLCKLRVLRYESTGKVCGAKEKKHYTGLLLVTRNRGEDVVRLEPGACFVPRRVLCAQRRDASRALSSDANSRLCHLEFYSGRSSKLRRASRAYATSQRLYRGRSLSATSFVAIQVLENDIKKECNKSKD